MIPDALDKVSREHPVKSETLRSLACDRLRLVVARKVAPTRLFLRPFVLIPASLGRTGASYLPVSLSLCAGSNASSDHRAIWRIRAAGLRVERRIGVVVATDAIRNAA